MPGPKHTPSATSASSLPESFDWRDKGAVTAVKDQGSLGTCWIFSTIGNLEGQRFLNGDALVDLSVEHVLECDATKDADSINADCGMFGGWPYLAMEGIIARGGVFADADMPYCAAVGYGKDGSCMPCMADGYDEESCGNHSDDDGGLPLYCEPEGTRGQGPDALCKGESADTKFAMSISSWTDASSTEADDIAASLVDLGPLSVAMDASKLQFYKSGVFNPSKCSTTALNHALVMVGYGTDEADGDYFTIKNSWADKWGEDGYFRIAKADDAGTCGINTAVVSAVV
jgi:cathepsin F